MFTNLLDWWRGRDAARAARRGIFAYRVPGVGRRYADPLAKNRLLRAAFGDRWPACLTDLEKLNRPPTAGEATGLGDDGLKARAERFRAVLAEAVEIARAAFDLPPFDAATRAGVTDEAALGLLVEFFGFARDEQDKFDTLLADLGWRVGQFRHRGSFCPE